MRRLNRRALVDFLKSFTRMGIDDDASMDDDDQGWDDECIDEEIKTILGGEENGTSITLDLVAHMEYFYNTLQCNFKPINPFECQNSAKMFPALHCHLKTPTAQMTGALSLY